MLLLAHYIQSLYIIVDSQCFCFYIYRLYNLVEVAFINNKKKRNVYFDVKKIEAIWNWQNI